MSDNKKTMSERIRSGFLRMAPRFRSHVIYKFDEMEQFRLFTLSAIESEKKFIQKRFDEDTKDLTEEEINEYFNWNAEDYFMVEDVFTEFALNSFIVILYSYIESGLNTICNAEYSDKARWQEKQGIEPLTIYYKDMKEEGIRRAKLYLEKVIGLNLHADKKPWSEIDTLRKIRNSIVHDKGRAKEKITNDTNIKQHIKKGRLELKNHGERRIGGIVIKPEYLDFILPTVKEFFRNIE